VTNDLSQTSDPWRETPAAPSPVTPPKRQEADANVLWAALLIGAGVLLLAAQFGVRWGAFLWPLWIIVPGVALLLLGYTVGRAVAEPLVVLGSIVSSTGLLLFYANASGHWASWAYLWALIAPTSIGLGLWLLGQVKRRSDLVKSGGVMVKIGLILFAAFGAFFELVIGISGLGLGRYAWPILLIGLGALFVIKAVRNNARRE